MITTCAIFLIAGFVARKLPRKSKIRIYCRDFFRCLWAARKHSALVIQTSKLEEENIGLEKEKDKLEGEILEIKRVLREHRRKRAGMINEILKPPKQLTVH